MRAVVFFLALMAIPSALAIDLLPSEITLGATEARVLVRSSEGSVRVETDPVVLVAATAPDLDPTDFAPSPRVLNANATWHGLDGIVVVVLRRADPETAVDIIVEDGTRTGVSLEWPALGRDVPLSAAIVIATLAAVGLGRSRYEPRR